MIHNI